ncbi:MAG: hypothetical protein ACR2LE_03575 [Nocardioidaceae bacterium]
MSSAPDDDWPEYEPDDDIHPTWSSHSMHALPRDAQLMGLDATTQEGALVAMAGSLNAGKLSHRLVAWLMIACFVLPVLITSLTQLF